MKSPRRVLWRTKLLVLLLAFAIVPSVAIAFIAFDTMERTMTESTLDGLEALARAKAEAIDQFTDIRRRDVERMAQLIAPQLTALLAVEAQREKSSPQPPSVPEEPPEQLDDAQAIGPDGTPKPVPSPPPKKRAGEPPHEEPKPVDLVVEQKRDELQQKLGLLLWDQGAFEELIVMDRNGLVQASTFREHVGKTAAPIEYFDRGRKATYVQPVFLSPITNELTMVIATPIRDDSNSDIGVLAARLNLKRFFWLINDFTGLGKTGETVVAKKLGDEVVFMAPTRHDDNAALNRKIKVGSRVSPELQQAARGDIGRGVITDYRGVKVFAAWRSVPSLEWGLVSKIDRAEAAAPIQAARNRIIGLALVVCGLVMIASLLAARQLVRPLGELKEATDKISKGNFDVELDIRSGDEIGELADSFERMVAAIKYFREPKTATEEEIEEERRREDEIAPS